MLELFIYLWDRLPSISLLCLIFAGIIGIRLLFNILIPKLCQLKNCKKHVYKKDTKWRVLGIVFLSLYFLLPSQNALIGIAAVNLVKSYEIVQKLTNNISSHLDK